jgi:hypothetical protein
MLFGNVELASTYLQPVGTLLAETTTLASTRGGWNPETVLWTCTPADLPNIYFLVATNGDDRVGGYWEIGNGHGSAINDGMPGVYATFFQYVGIRQTMAGVLLSRYWQKVPVTNYEISGNNLLIKTKHIPPLTSELYRVSSLPPSSGSGSAKCGTNNTSGMTSAGSYTCVEPNAYIQLSGSSSSIPFGHDAIGSDSNTSYAFWWANNGFPYGMRMASTLIHNNTCVARSATPVVTFPIISVEALNQGDTRQADFTVQLECDSANVASGTNPGQTAMGIQVSQTAYQAARSLDLVNNYNGISHLVSDNYGSDSSLATGVGITLSNQGNNMNLLGWPLQTGGGPTMGWYPALQNANDSGSSAVGYTSYTQTITATLTKLPGLTPTGGRINATAYVMVRVQ